MKRPKTALVSLLLIGVILTGCGSSTGSKSSKSANSTATSSSSTTSRKTPESAANQQATMKPYNVPKADRQSQQYQKSGVLSLPGEFSYDRVGTKLQLVQKHTYKQQTSTTGLRYRVTTIKTIKNTAKTAAAKSMAAQAFNIQHIPNPYRTVQLTFNVTNSRNQTVKIDGIKQITINNKGTVTSASGLSDASAGQSVGAHQTKTFTAMVLAGPADYRVTHLSVAFSGSYSTSGDALSKAPSALALSLQ